MRFSSSKGILDNSMKAIYMREGPVDAATKRSEKIARHKREADLQKQLEVIQRRRMDRKRRLFTKAVVNCEDDTKEEGHENSDNDDDDDDDERQLWMLMLRLAHGRAIDVIPMLVSVFFHSCVIVISCHITFLTLIEGIRHW